MRTVALTDRSDADLLELIATQENRDALRELYDRHVSWLGARLRNRCADDGVVHDALQDTFDAQVEVAFTALPDRFRAVVELVDLDGNSYQQAADALGVPVGTVMSRLHRARRRIRDHLDTTGLDNNTLAVRSES